MLLKNNIHKPGEVYSIIKDNEPVPGCTISAATAPFFGAQGNGICRLGANRFLYTIQQPQSSVYDYGTAAFYVLVEADGTYSRPLALPAVPAFGKGRSARFSGIPRADGSLVLMTNRSERKAVVWDFADPETPKALRAYTLSGNPDLGAFFRGRSFNYLKLRQFKPRES